MAALLLLGAMSASGAAAATRAYVRQSIDLKLAHPREADKLEAVMPDPAVTRPPRKAVTDLVLLASVLPPSATAARHHHAGEARGEGQRESMPGDIDAALAAANETQPQARLYGVRLLVVVGGRLQHSASATCGGWRDDRSLCRLACDGGRFEITRRLTAEGPTFRLHVSGRDGIDDGLLVSSCDGGGGPEVRLKPKAGEGAEIVLQAD